MEPEKIYVHSASKIKKYGSMHEVRSEWTGKTTEYIRNDIATKDYSQGYQECYKHNEEAIDAYLIYRKQG